MSRLSRLIPLAALALLLIVPVAHAAKKPPIRLAIEAPITGPQASNGIDMLRGVQLAVRQVNAKGGVLGRKVVIVRGDDKGDSANAVAVAEDVIAEGPDAIVGPYNSSVGLLNLPLYRKARVVPIWLTSNTNTQGQGITLQPMNSQVAPQEAKFLLGKGYQKVTILVDTTANGAYTKGIATRLRRLLEDKGVTVNWVQIVETADAPPGYYAAKVAEALATSPDVIYSSTYFPEGVEIAKAIVADGTSTPCHMSLGNIDAGFVSGAGIPTSQRCTFTGVPEATKLSSAKRFVKDYRKAFKTDPGVWGVFTYDSANAYFRAVRRTHSTNYTKVLKELRKMKNVPGQTGKITIDPKNGYRKTLPFLAVLRVNSAGDFVVNTGS
ncbi:unannotated protein [freshwater metagenome]|uniref:Unannotated protein n=1 Tax=freshwater metagenome TaxID=449393 RepID=A0A6J7DIH9_9ZZZZ